MEMKTEYSTFIPVSSRAVGKTIQDIEKYGVKVVSFYWTPATFDQKFKPKPNLELSAGMGIQVEGQRKQIDKMARDLLFP